jgi:NAD(P)-dependent dehydrogenase (short-subunit alcohol dehydrogenase family)
MRSEQNPINSGFTGTSTTDDVINGIDLHGKTAIVTGGYSGLGLEMTRTLAAAGARVVVPVRSPEKARAALAGIPRVEQAALDLLDPQSIDAFARNFIESGRVLHMLVNSAGIMAVPLERDSRGYESHFAANHLGHFQLTAGLWPALRNAGGARVVTLSSRAHRRAGVDFDDPQFEHRAYDKWVAYGQSKSANALFAVALDRRGEQHGIRGFAVHPGSILTDLARSVSDDELHAMGLTRDDAHGRIPAGQSVAEGGDFKTISQGAATSVWCATSPSLRGMGGVYCENVDIAVVTETEEEGRGVRPWAIDPEFAERLWNLSERFTRRWVAA